MTQPTDLDHRNAAARRIIAERQQAEYDTCQRLADAALGPGWQPWMKLVLLDSDHRRTGDNTPAAVAYKVYRGEHRTTENSVFLRQMPDGTVKTSTRYEPLFGELLEEKHPTRTIAVKGERVPVGRYEVAWAAMERYVPKSAEALAALRETRERKREEREEKRFQTESPLWALMERADAEEGRGR